MRLSALDSGRLMLIPPDGLFELAEYSVPDYSALPAPVRLPFVVPNQRTRSPECETITVTLQLVEPVELSGVRLKIPVSELAARCSAQASIGSAEYRPELDAVVWTIGSMSGKRTIDEALQPLEIESERSTLVSTASLTLSIEECGVAEAAAATQTRPIQLQCTMLHHALTGAGLHSIQVRERENYETKVFVRARTTLRVVVRA